MATLTPGHSSTLRRLVGAAASAVALWLAFDVAACGGGSKPQPEAATSDTPATETMTPPHTLDVSMTEMPEEVEEQPDAGSATTKKEAPKPPEPQKTVRRPQPTFNNEQEIATTIGEGGAVMKLGAAVTLRIPEGALRDGMNIRFALSRSNPSKSAPPRLGQSFTLEPKVRSAGPPFELSFALPEGASAVDLVVQVAPDPKQKAPQKSDHRLIAPKRVDATKKLALFELEELPGADVYLTRKSAPTASADATSPAKQPAAGAKAPASGK